MKSLIESIQESLNNNLYEALNVKVDVNFIPCKVTKGNFPYCIAIGEIFNVKNVKYAQQIQNILNELKVYIEAGVEDAQKLVKDASTKLIWVIRYDNGKSKAMICNSKLLKPLDSGVKLQ